MPELPAIALFDGGEDGYGWAVKVPGLHGYNLSYNFDCRMPGRAYPAHHPNAQGLGTTGNIANNPITSAFEWEDANGVPLVIWCYGQGDADARIGEMTDGTYTNNNQGILPYKCGVKYRYDQDATADPDEEMAFFCNGSTAAGGAALIRRKKDGTIDSGATDAHDFEADWLAVVGGDLWAAVGYKVRKLTLNADPGKDASWGTAITVGVPSWGINKILPLGGTPIVIKPEGVFKYNPAPSAARYENMTPWVNPDPANGKNAIVDGRGRIYYDTVDGEILVVQFGNMSQQGPTRMTTFDADTPCGRITAMTVDGDFVYAATEPGQIRTQGGFTDKLDLVVYKNDGGVYTDLTTNTTDGKKGTYGDVTALTSSDSIIVGANTPIAGVYLEFYTTRTSDVVGSDVDVAYSSAADGTFTAVDDDYDSTSSFSRNGAIGIVAANISDLVADESWAAVTSDPGGGTYDGLYWMRITPGTATALAGVLIRAIHIIPYRPALDSGIYPATGYKLSGLFNSILVGAWRGEHIVWHDVWTIPQERVDQLLVSRLGCVAASMTKRHLLAFTKDSIWTIPVGADAHPARMPYTDLVTGSPGVVPNVLWCSGNDFSEAGEEYKHRVKELTKGIMVKQPGVQSDSEAYLYTWWDGDADRVQKHDLRGGTARITGRVDGSGTVLYAAYALRQAGYKYLSPYLTSIAIPEDGWKVLPETEEVHRADLTNPMSR